MRIELTFLDTVGRAAAVPRKVTRMADGREQGTGNREQPAQARGRWDPADPLELESREQWPAVPCSLFPVPCSSRGPHLYVQIRLDLGPGDEGRPVSDDVLHLGASPRETGHRWRPGENERGDLLGEAIDGCVVRG